MLDLLAVDFGTRNLGLWDQFPVSDRNEIIKVIQRNLGYRNIGISACAYVNGDQILLFLFFDFDSDDISVAFEDAKRCYNHFVDMGISCIVNFSGRKGFHVLVELEPKNYSSKQHRDIMRFYRDMLGLETLDEATFGDKKRLYRIPNTWNINGSWCRTLAWNDGEKLDLDEIIPEVYEPDRISIVEPNEEIIHFWYPCVEYLVDNREFWIASRGKYEPSEPFRLTWAGIRIWAGKTVDEMVMEAEAYDWDDFDSEKTRKKLEYLMERRWYPHKCERLRELGYCLDWINCDRKWRFKMDELGIGNGEV